MSIEGLESFRGWKQAKGSHVKAVFQVGSDENRVESAPPYAVHHGEVSKGVRRSLVKWLISRGLLSLLIIFAGILTLMLTTAQ